MQERRQASGHSVSAASKVWCDPPNNIATDN